MHQKNRYRLLPQKLASTLNLVSLSLTVCAAFTGTILGVFTFDALAGPTAVASGLWIWVGTSLAVMVIAGATYVWLGNRTPFNLAEEERLAEMIDKDPEVQGLLRRAVETYGQLDRMHLQAAEKLFIENLQAVQAREEEARAGDIKSKLARALGSDL